MPGWWATKARQASRHVFGRVSPTEREDLGTWLKRDQLALFGSMHRADQRHGLDVVGRLRADGHDDPDLLMAALLHDCAKGPDVRLWHRVAWSLSERYGEGVLKTFRRMPGFEAAFDTLRHHAEVSATLAQRAGCSERTADLIRYQDAPVDPVSGRALQVADEAS